jgi:hypothetical protein
MSYVKFKNRMITHSDFNYEIHSRNMSLYLHIYVSSCKQSEVTAVLVTRFSKHIF